MPPPNVQRDYNPIVGFGRSQAVQNELQQLLGQTQLKLGEQHLKTIEQKGLEKEQFAKELKAELEKIKERQRKAKKRIGFLKVLDFIPGGKWVKPAIKASVGAHYADKLREALESASDTFKEGYGQTFLEGQAEGFSDKMLDMRSGIDPTKMFAQSFIGDILSPGFGKQKSFKDIAKQKSGVNWFNKAMTEEFGESFTPQKFTPFKDHLRGKFGLLKDEKFGERLTRGWEDLKDSDIFEGMERMGLSQPLAKSTGINENVMIELLKNPELLKIMKDFGIFDRKGK